MGPLGPWSGDYKPGIVYLGQIGVWGEELLIVVLEFLPICLKNELFVSAVHKLARDVHDVFNSWLIMLQCNSEARFIVCARTDAQYTEHTGPQRWPCPVARAPFRSRRPSWRLLFLFPLFIPGLARWSHNAPSPS